MNISVLCSNESHPIYASLRTWMESRRAQHAVELVSAGSQLGGGDLLFLISCSEFIPAALRAKYRHALVVHASALPRGRGWSPHVWQVIEGSNAIPVTLLEAEDRIDSGRMWRQVTMTLEGHELYDEINAKLFAITLELMDFAIENAASVSPREQSTEAPTYYRKRVPEDSRLDPDKSIAGQFDLLRVADPDRYPCFLEHRGRRYLVILRKDEE